MTPTILPNFIHFPSLVKLSAVDFIQKKQKLPALSFLIMIIVTSVYIN